MKGLTLWVYRPDAGDFTNGGLSSKVKTITVVHPKLAGVFEPTPDAPAFELVARPGPYGPILRPLEQPADDGVERRSIGPMMGGNFASCSDSRWSRLLEDLGYVGMTAVPIHDRFETPEQYRQLST